jgi:hypothetical protein
MCSLYDASLINGCDTINLFASTFIFIVQTKNLSILSPLHLSYQCVRSNPSLDQNFTSLLLLLFHQHVNELLCRSFSLSVTFRWLTLLHPALGINNVITRSTVHGRRSTVVLFICWSTVDSQLSTVWFSLKLSRYFLSALLTY